MEVMQEGAERDNSNTSSSSPLSMVFSFWKDFDLEKERSALDEQGLKIAENQENSQKNRRKLAENTRDFKKASTEEKLVLFNTLLKAYQEEVDKLTKRAKFGENSFLNIYQKLYEAPDPYPALSLMSEQDSKVSELESENQKMKAELEEYKTEATLLRNQQSTIRRMEERYKQLEQQMEEKVKEIVEMKQHSLVEENQKTLEILKEREGLLQDQLRQAKDSLSNMQKLHELAQNQLFEIRAQSEEDRAAKQSEVNLLTDEVDRAQAHLLSIEREKGLLLSQLQSMHEETGKKTDEEANDVEGNRVMAKEKMISQLNLEIQSMEKSLSDEREQHVNELKKVTSLLNAKDGIIHDIRKELEFRPTQKLVDDLHKKVKILQAVGYNSIEAEDWEVATTSGGEQLSKMESLLLDKNRKIEHELTQIKMKLSEKKALLEKAEVKVEELNEKLNEHVKLIQKLEDDISKGYSSKVSHDGRSHDWDFNEPGVDSAEVAVDQRNALTSVDKDQSSMLKVICNQRDRFRLRLHHTEDEMRVLKEKMVGLGAELEKTKGDNVKLYGKIRYVQDYSSIDKVVSRGGSKKDIESGLSSDTESKYRRIYEEDINPFAAFSKRERDQRYRELGIREKITLNSGRYLLANKTGRSIAFFYTIGLHILVFTCLYKMSALSYLRSSNGTEELSVVGSGGFPLSLL